MSTVLFFNVDKKISRGIIQQIKSICKLKKADMEFCLYGEFKGTIGENYFVDSMWTPCRFQLRNFINAERYTEFVNIFESVKEIIKLLLVNDYSINLFLNSVGEDKKALEGEEMLSMANFHENLSLEYAKIYKIVVYEN